MQQIAMRRVQFDHVQAQPVRAVCFGRKIVP
jgi:hypothetical protein